MPVIVELLKLLTTTDNISQLSKEADVSRSQVNRIILGVTEPRLETAERLLNALGYDLKVVRKAGNAGT